MTTHILFLSMSNCPVPFEPLETIGDRLCLYLSFFSHLDRFWIILSHRHPLLFVKLAIKGFEFFFSHDTRKLASENPKKIIFFIKRGIRRGMAYHVLVLKLVFLACSPSSCFYFSSNGTHIRGYTRATHETAQRLLDETRVLHWSEQKWWMFW